MHSGWAGLQKDLLGEVLKRLASPADYLRFSIVCKSWFYLAKENRRQRMSRPPMLLISDKENSWKLYDTIHDEVLHMQLRVPNRRFCGSSKGWLIFVDENFTVTLLNPFPVKLREKRKTNATIIRLPPLRGRKHWIPNCDYYVFKASLSADPILDADNCVLTVIYLEYYRLAFIKPSAKNKRWTYVDKSWAPIDDAVYSRGMIYAVGNDSQLSSLNISSLSKLKLAQRVPCWDGLGKRYLALGSNEKEFWMVKRYIQLSVSDDQDINERPHHLKHKRETTAFKIFKINIDAQDKWTEEETLGDVALFVGDNSSISVVASHFPGCRPNCIYFSHDDDSCSSIEPYGPNDCGVYDITSRSVLKPYADDAEKLLKLTRQPPIWFVPCFYL